MDMLESLKAVTDRRSKVYHPTIYLILYYTVIISFIFKNYKLHNIFGGIATLMEEKILKYWKKKSSFTIFCCCRVRFYSESIGSWKFVSSDNILEPSTFRIDEVKEFFVWNELYL